MYKKYVAADLTILMDYNYLWNVSIICKHPGQSGLFLLYILACCVAWHSGKSIIPRFYKKSDYSMRIKDTIDKDKAVQWDIVFVVENKFVPDL